MCVEWSSWGGRYYLKKPSCGGEGVCGQEIIYVGIDTTHTHSHKSIWHGFIIIQPSPAPHKSQSGHFYYEGGHSLHIKFFFSTHQQTKQQRASPFLLTTNHNTHTGSRRSLCQHAHAPIITTHPSTLAPLAHILILLLASLKSFELPSSFPFCVHTTTLTLELPLELEQQRTPSMTL